MMLAVMMQMDRAIATVVFIFEVISNCDASQNQLPLLSSCAYKQQDLRSQVVQVIVEQGTS